MQVEDYESGVRLIRNFLSSDECRTLIESSEARGFEEAKIDTGSGQEIFKDIRNNDRVFFDDRELASQLFQKINPFVPNIINGWRLFSLNERFRFYRYKGQQYFKWHRDGSYKRSYFEVSKMTFMIYLNGNFEGGETDFRDFKVIPEAGAALVFPHELLHQGLTLINGTKYVLRTDVMYDKT